MKYNERRSGVSYIVRRLSGFGDVNTLLGQNFWWNEKENHFTFFEMFPYHSNIKIITKLVEQPCYGLFNLKFSKRLSHIVEIDLLLYSSFSYTMLPVFRDLGKSSNLLVFRHRADSYLFCTKKNVKPIEKPVIVEKE